MDIDETYPDYLREHMEEYDYLIAPPVSKIRIAFKKGILAVKGFLRKLHGKLV